MTVAAMEWAGASSEIGARVELDSKRCLDAYRVNPALVLEHANIERSIAQGGYGRRQIFELVQNAADALIGFPQGRISVVLTQYALYCANEGAPIDPSGVDALLSSHISMKRGTEIGRFGLGFKSVLGVSGRPEFYSRSGSFEFDPDFSVRKIREVVSDAESVPLLRIARPVDPQAAASADPVLAELMEWATTVVKLPRDPGTSDWLRDDIAQFPAEFLLFSPHIGRLELSNRMTKAARILSVESHDSELLLKDGDRESAWKIFRTDYKLSDAAKADAGELSARATLPIIWAVRIGGKAAPGFFWAFFPTEYPTTLSGILNAPWKTNEDRQNLLKGVFNRELLDAAADLVVESLPVLSTPEDPSRFLDILPGRLDEFRNWADNLLNIGIYHKAGRRPSVPNQAGVLTEPSLLHLHPDGIPRSALDRWAAYPGRPTDWCHPSTETRERRPRVDRLFSVAGRSADTLPSWLEALVVDRTPAASIAVVQAAALIIEENEDELSTIRLAEIVLTSNGTLACPAPEAVFLPAEYQSIDSELLIVDSTVATDPDARAALEKLGVAPVDAAGELQRLLRNDVPHPQREWVSVWQLSRRIDVQRALDVMRNNTDWYGDLRVRTLDGTYRSLCRTLLPGAIVPEDGSRDQSVVIDTQFHKEDLALLGQLGAVSSPAPGRGDDREPWFGGYRYEMVEAYVTSIRSGQRPAQHLLRFAETGFVGPLEPLLHLSDEGRVAFTSTVLAAITTDEQWTLAHSTRPNAYPQRKCPSPVLWLLRTEGKLLTSQGVRSVREAVGPALASLKAIFPVADCSDKAAQLLGLPSDFGELSADLWDVGFAAVDDSTDDLDAGRFYSTAVRYVQTPPTAIWCRISGSHNLVARTSVTAVSVQAEFDTLARQAIPVMLVPTQEDAALLVQRWSLVPRESSVRTEVFFVSSAPETTLGDAFPTLRPYLHDEQPILQLIKCSLLRLDRFTPAGKVSEETSFYIDGGDVYYRDDLGAIDLLRRLNAELSLGMGELDFAAILEHRGEQQRRSRIARIRHARTAEDRLLLAVGAEAIRRRLQPALLDAVKEMHGEVADHRLAQLAYAVYGVDALKTFRGELEEAGLEPPSQWSGGRDARAFVRALGFPPEFAGFRRADRDPLLRVDGPPKLPPLHDFQQKIVTRTRELLKEEVGRRGLLSLPTGAGKTRIAVQALIEMIRDEGLAGPILWIAQTDELCEQAVQTWSYVWRGLGPEHALHVSRLWAGNEAEPFEDGPHVVVATIAKLGGCVKDDVYKWLSRATCVVIDEAHGSTEPSYTAVLTWLGLGRSRGRDRCPLIGLTATPFRGVNVEETQRLVSRYGEYRLDAAALNGDPYGVLQGMGVLAKVRHQLLEGATIRLTDTDLDYLEQFGRLPSSVEQRVGTDTNRNGVLLRSIEQLPKDWTVLLFATSVDHAETMAGLLSLEGISAVSISAGTDPGARRHYVNEFRDGRIRVLTNYGVLAQGFDAPAVAAVYVARPTFSPNLYQQMIGRGLRGPLNGGKAECLIVNVADNFQRFRGALAFKHFEYLWKGVP